jgi:glycerate-2-kinase
MTSQLREEALQIWTAAVDSVRARSLVARSIHRDGEKLTVGRSVYLAADFDRVIVVGAGKAGSAMAQGLVEKIDTWRPVRGWINVPEGTELELQNVRTHPARPSGINEPTAAGVDGSLKILDLVQSCSDRDLCFALISGGGSALLPAPIPEIKLEDKLRLTQFLSGAGADIIELNTVRKHLSVIKGGGLLRAFRGKKIITLILSDVLGDPVDQIASGPTVPDTTSTAQALAILEKYDPHRTLPTRIYDALRQQNQETTLPEKTQHHDVTERHLIDPKPPGKPSRSMSIWDQKKENQRLSREPSDYETLIIGNNAGAVSAAERAAQQLGFITESHSATASEGLAEEIGRQLAQRAIEQLRDASLKVEQPFAQNPEPNQAALDQAEPKAINERGSTDSSPNDSQPSPHDSQTGNTPAPIPSDNLATINGGEPTVILCPPEQRGLGGRNQQLVLAAYQHLLQANLTDLEWSRLCLISGGTDGEDGPTDAAGAILDRHVHQRAIDLKLRPQDFLGRNDAYHFFEQVDGLIVTGPTGTNVCDVRVLLIQAADGINRANSGDMRNTE